MQCALPTRGVTALFGRSGSGKTTLLRCIAGLERPVLAQAELHGGGQRALWRHLGAEMLDDVCRVGHEMRALLDEMIAALGAWIGRRAGDGEDLAVLFERAIGGDQGAGALGCFDHDHARYDAIGESDRMTLRFVKPS